ncbi:MAG: catalase family protein [Bdellovibrionaceae bacterium]|nr:catalase family protein [Pseudobdellovibrionaceae bacterium]
MHIIIIISFFITLTACSSTVEKSRVPNSIEPDMQIDPLLEEFEGGSSDYENKIHQDLIGFSRELMTKMVAKADNNTMTRDAHAKSHGCLKAKFSVDNSLLPVQNRVGIFAQNKEYDSWVRFSNNDHLPIRRDNEYDLRGIAVKVMGVPGQKILSGYEDAQTQDFLMYGSKTFFIKDNADYIGFIRGLRDDNAAKILITEQPKAAIKTRYAQWKVSHFTNPLNMYYHSAVPIRLGASEDKNRTAIKYGVVPCSTKEFPSPVSKKDNNYMRKNLRHTLQASHACYEFQIQLQKDPASMPVEDGTVAWPEEIYDYGNQPFSPYITVAKIHIEKQNFDTKERDVYCENLSFTPWHALTEHKPLGRTMRMRRDLYKATSTFRRTHNGASFIEPTHYEID